MIGQLSNSRWFGNPLRRRATFLVLVLLLGLLGLFPQHYRAAVTMTPTDPANLGLGGALGQLGAYNSAFGAQAATEVSLRVARSQQVHEIVIKKLGLMQRLGFGSVESADRWLGRNVDVRVIRGGIMQIEASLRDPQLATALVGAFADATRTRLAEISRAQTAYKREILMQLVRDAGERLRTAQAAYDQFRRQTRYAAPGPAIGTIGGRIPSLQAELKGKEIELQAARRFATDENMTVRQILAEMDALRAQLREAESLDPNDPYSVNRVVVQLTQVQKLEQELTIARTLYESYLRFLEGTSVEDLTSTATIRILEPPYIDSSRQLNILPAGLALILLLIALAVEFYELRPPLEAYRTPNER